MGAAWVADCELSIFVGASVCERVHLRGLTRAREYQAVPNLARWIGLPRAERRSPRGDRLRGEFVFVQQPDEPIATADTIELRRL